jgi:hypothetical protein
VTQAVQSTTNSLLGSSSSSSSSSTPRVNAAGSTGSGGLELPLGG